jgi:hypothetical protein
VRTHIASTHQKRRNCVIGTNAFVPSVLMAHHELGQLLDEDLTDSEKTELEEAEAVCRTFVAWDLSNDVTDVKDRLAKILDTGS